LISVVRLLVASLATLSMITSAAQAGPRSPTSLGFEKLCLDAGGVPERTLAAAEEAGFTTAPPEAGLMDLRGFSGEVPRVLRNGFAVVGVRTGTYQIDGTAHPATLCTFFKIPADTGQVRRDLKARLGFEPATQQTADGTADLWRYVELDERVVRAEPSLVSDLIKRDGGARLQIVSLQGSMDIVVLRYLNVSLTQQATH
jgi:hypothetical protein